MSNLHSTMSCVLSEELASTPLKAVQVMVAKALSLITLVTVRVLVTLSSDMVSSGNIKSDAVTTQKHSIHEPGDGWGRDTSGRAHQCTRGTL